MVLARKKVHDIDKDGPLYFLLNAFIGAYNRRTDVMAKTSSGNSADVLTAINNLTSLVKEKFMGLKEDNEKLTDQMSKVEEATQLIADDVTALKNEIKEANERANIDLSPLVTRAENIVARLTGIAGPNAGSDPEAPAGGGETGGGEPA